MVRPFVVLLVMTLAACSPSGEQPAAAVATVASTAVAPRPEPPCSEPPPPIRDMIAARTGWRVLNFQDLAADDRGLWMENRPFECPGAVEIVLSKGAAPSWAVTLVSGSDRPLRQQLIVFLPNGGGAFRQEVVVPPVRYPYPTVIWTAPPGNYQDIETGRRLHSDSGSFVMEEMEAWAVQYVYVHGRFERLTISY